MKNEDFDLVVGSQEDEEYARNVRKSVIGITASTLAIIILLGTYVYNNREEVLEEPTRIEQEATTYDDSLAYVEENAPENVADEVSEAASEEVSEVVNEDFSFGNKDIDYSNVEAFYNQIVEYRSKYGTFAESFQSTSDVMNLVNFYYLFDETYEVETPINSQAQFDEIIRDYYKSCASHGVDANLNILFKQDSVIQRKIKESEDLANNLKNGSGKDYTISNEYYTWFGVNLVDKRTAIMETIKYAPLIDGLREQYEQYRYVGNMLNARKYQKNDSLPIEKTDIYYGYKFEDGVNVTEIHNSFSCPDGIDNFVSKPENKEETKWIISEDGSVPFERVDYNFEYILNKRRVR